jgi:antitoxin Xre/MbcA/ParS-like protein
METVAVADPSDVLGRSAYAAGEYLGLNKAQVGYVVGRDRSSIDRSGIAPDSKSGQLALIMVRVYRSLYALMGGDKDNMQHFMSTPNQGTGGVPAEQIQDVEGLVRVCHYLDAVRGRG